MPNFDYILLKRSFYPWKSCQVLPRTAPLIHLEYNLLLTKIKLYHIWGITTLSVVKCWVPLLLICERAFFEGIRSFNIYWTLAKSGSWVYSNEGNSQKSLTWRELITFCRER